MGFRKLDVLIITALLDELDAVLAFGEGGKDAWKKGKDPDGFPYHYRELPREDGGEPLRVAAASFDEMGESTTAERATALVKHLDPACLAMCGICAGRKKDVTLGDVIVADRVYSYDDGKRLAWRSPEGHRSEQFFHDIKTYNLEDTWRVDAAYFARELGWTGDLVKARPLSLEAQQEWLLRALFAHEQEGAVSPDAHKDRDACCPSLHVLWDRLRLPEPGLLVETPGELALTAKGRGLAKELTRKFKNGHPKDRKFKIHVGPIATGKVVQKDPELFDRLELIGRKTLGVEMEAVAIAKVAEHLGRHAIIVKAVSDYGDHDKDDEFRKFATRASAEVLIRFLLRKLEPPDEDTDELEREGQASGRFLLSGTDSLRGNDLLSRVATITDLRVQASGATARIRRRNARPPLRGYLEVSRLEGQFARVFPVAAVDQVTTEVFDAFLDIDAGYRRADSGLCSTLVYGGDPPPKELESRAAARRVLLQSFNEYQGLIDFRGYLSRQTSRLEQDPVYPPALYIPQRAAFLSGDDQEHETDDALGELARLLASPLGRFVLVLGDFGTGKTFLLHELARRMARESESLIPVLIELRSLEKTPELDALVAQHFMRAGMERFDRPAFRYMLAEGRLVLLFDGFDELALRVSYDRVVEHFATLIQAAQGEAKVVITSRTQHFLSDKQAKLALAHQASSVKGYRLARLRPFTHVQIRQFLVNRLESADKAERRFQLLQEVRDLLGLAHNPRMLGFITDIPEEKLLEAKERNGTITSAGLYELLLKQWLENEIQRAHPKGALPGLDEAQRWKAVTDLAMRLWQRTESSLNIQELPEELVAAVQALATHELKPGEVEHQIGSGTLLVRDEEGNFSFIHQSVMEWLVARAVAREIRTGGRAALLEAREISPLMADFVWGLAGREEAERWAQHVLEIEAGETAHKNAFKLLERLGVEAKVRLKLAGQDLRGQDFSGRNLRHADLSDAILSGVPFIGADLTGAKLVGAELERADFSDAQLVGADLRGSNMLGARLLGADATGARFENAWLREAKLLGARLDPSAIEGVDLFGAAWGEEVSAEPIVSAMSNCFAIAISPDGRLLASGHAGWIGLWDLDTGTQRRILQGHSSTVTSVAFSGDGKTLASGAWDNTVRLWDVATGAERRVLKGHSSSVASVAFSGDGKTLASGAWDSTVRLWDVATGAERRVLKGHSSPVTSVAFSGDGKTLASGAWDSTVRLWRIDTGECLVALVSLAEGWVAFTPDGRYRSAGTIGGAFWHVIGLCRFEPGELEPYLPLRVAHEDPLYRLPG